MMMINIIIITLILMNECDYSVIKS